MDNSTHENEEKLLALVNARLDAKLKEAEIAEKTKPWKTLVQPTTLMALLTALTTLTAGTVTMLQFWGQQQDADAARASAELSAERVLVQSIILEKPNVAFASGISIEDANNAQMNVARDQLTALARAGMFPVTKSDLIKSGLVTPDPQ
jgi:hypothetical protein